MMNSRDEAGREKPSPRMEVTIGGINGFLFGAPLVCLQSGTVGIVYGPGDIQFPVKEQRMPVMQALSLACAGGEPAAVTEYSLS